jgi:HD superfamily phosphohydrolase
LKANNSCPEAALTQNFTEPVRDAVWGHIYLTPELEALTRTQAFMRLYRIAQLGPASLCYPGATHTRAAHSLGVYHLTRRLLTTLAGRGAANWTSACGLRSMLCAALLHDIGHFPYAHSLKELPLSEHETLGARLILTEPLKSMVAKTGADPELAAAIVMGESAQANFDKNSGQICSDSGPSSNCNFNSELKFYRALLSGALDPDKLDYLNRDARYCGVPYGSQDVDYIISILYPHPERGVEIDSRGIAGVESLLFSKYLMYRSVYWHRSVRAATAMIKKALFAGFSDGVLKAEELYGLDDYGLFSLLASRKHPLFLLGERVRQGLLYTAVREEPFNSEKHSAFETITKRGEYEEAFAKEFSCETGRKINASQVIIDVPERTNFETNLFVRDENLPFGESSSFFKSATVASFVKTLRIVRVYVEREA